MRLCIPTSSTGAWLTEDSQACLNKIEPCRRMQAEKDTNLPAASPSPHPSLLSER